MSVSIITTNKYSFDQEQKRLLLKHGSVGVWLAIVLMPLGNVLDIFVYPYLADCTLRIRLICTGSLMGILLFFNMAWGKKYVRFFSTSWAMLPNWSICWMIYISEGFSSSYWIGLVLMIVVICLLLPYTLGESISYCSIVLFSYLISSFLHEYHYESSIDSVDVATSLFFLSLISIICCTSCHFRHLARVKEFNLRYELSRRNEQLTASYEKLAELDKMKSAFFANVSHELRTPLTLIIVPLDKLLQNNQGLPDAVHKTIRTVMNNALRLLKLINDLLELIRFDEGGKAALVFKPVHLSKFLPGIVNSVRQLALANELSVKLVNGPDSLFVSGDPDKLEVVFLNLLTNAIKFTPRGGRITVGWEVEKECILVHIEDTGVGIPEKDFSRIFDRFHQVDSSTTRQFQGVGLGLALVKELVDKHGGDLRVRSEVGKGSCFTVSLPLLKEVPERRISPIEDLAEQPHVIRTAARSANLLLLSKIDTYEDETEMDVRQGTATLLIVDDERDMRRFLVGHLSEQYGVLQASDGERGLALALERKPDLLVLDWMMPKKSGIEVCRALRKHQSSSDIKIIMLTARVDDTSKLEALSAGVDDFLTKPFSMVELETRIGNLLKLKKAEQISIQREKMNTLGHLSAGLLHEINNPINYAIMAINAIKRHVNSGAAAPEKLTQCVEDIDEAVKRVSSIITDLRDFAYPERNHYKSCFSLNDCLEKALKLVSPEIKAYTLIKEIPEETYAWGNATGIMHVLMNLILNSAKAVKKICKLRDPVITVKVIANESDVSICVWDNGVGIKSEALKRIFDPFYTGGKVGEGMGMGLTLCSMILQSHDSVLKAESREGDWASISFSIAASEAPPTLSPTVLPKVTHAFDNTLN